MATLIIHLSDLHIGCGTDFSQRAELIAEAAFSTVLDIDEVHVVFSGDITNAGKESEFALATDFLERLSNRIYSLRTLRPEVIVVPGNHDCDFSGDQSVREALLSTVRPQPKGNADAVCERIASVLANFNTFQRAQTSNLETLSLWASVKETPKIRYVLLNSSVFSQIKEEPGKLYVRPPQLTYDETKRTVFVMHHPLGWLVPENAFAVAQRSTVAGDLFLLGHEHQISAHRVIDMYDQSTMSYLKGHVLGDPKQSFNSAFQTIQLDTPTGFLQRTYRWVDLDKAYRLWPEKSQSTYQLWPSRSHGNLVLSVEGVDLLNSPGASFTHRRKDRVTLQDIFVWPNLKHSKSENETGQILGDTSFVSASTLVDDFGSLPSTVVIKGAEQHGKSALAQMLCLQLQRKDVCPLMIDASKISSWKENSLQERIDSAVKQLYGEHAPESFWKLAPSDRVLILDNFDLTQLSKGYASGVRILKKLFGKVVLMLDSYPGMDVVLSEFLLDENLADSKIYEILPTTFHHRLELIERWLSIGRPVGATEEIIKTMAAKMAKVVDETIGRNLIPAVPLFVLIILQRAEIDQDLNTVVQSGSHGFLYESMIQQALTNRVPCNLVTSLTYLTSLAATMNLHSQGAQAGLSQSQYEKFHVNHCERFDLELSVGPMQTQLEAADLLSQSQGVVRFKYPFHEYYFLARHLSQIDDWPTLEAQIDALVAAVHSERSANVLLFLAHLKRNPKIADKILAHATLLFSEYEEVNLFSKTLGLPAPSALDIRQILVEGSRAHGLALHQQDEADDEESQKALSDAAEERLKDRVSEVVSMNGAFKTLQVLGQVLRNHAGEIERNEKQSLVNTCVAMGLRILTFLYQVIDESQDDLIQMRSMQLRAERENISEVELAEALEDYTPSLVASLTVGTLIKIANAVGSEELSLTLRDVLSTSDTRRMVRLVTQLEHFSDFPMEDLKVFEAELLRDRPPLPYSVLRRFLIRRFYLFPVIEELKQAVLVRFDIKAKHFQMLEQKKLRKH